MPIYEWICTKCENPISHDELWLSLGDPDPPICEQCGEEEARVITKSSFRMK